MKKLIVIAFAAFLLTASCKQNETIIEKEIIKEFEKEVPERLLMHNVFLNLNDSISATDLDMVMNELSKLNQVESVLLYHAGKRAETGDARLDKDYDVALHVVFESEENLKKYSIDPLHLAVREKIKPFLIAPPVVFDYWTE